MDRSFDRNGFLALTGATGLIGHYLLAEFMRGGKRCVALVRNGARDRARLGRLLRQLGIDADRCFAEERIILLQADLNGSIEHPRGFSIQQVIHAAGCTRFHEDDSGDPGRTNVLGTTALLNWTRELAIGAFHLVSSAYVCGQCRGAALESASSPRPTFHNAYEQSKWESERLCMRWQQTDSANSLTIHRPSIVVGDHATGRTTTFNGFYLSIRAVELVARLSERQSLGDGPLMVRIPGCPMDCQNIVPVNYVAAMIAGIVARKPLHGKVYHLVHPSPPCNKEILQSVENYFRVSGFNFKGKSAHAPLPRTRRELAFEKMIEPIRPYFVDTPIFDRTNAAIAERALGVHCPRFDAASLERLCAFAASRQSIDDSQSQDDRACISDFFERFLPEMLPQSQVARMGLSATIRFEIADDADGQWVCRIDSGRLAQVHRGANGLCEDFGYRLDRTTFLQAVQGQLEPQQAFFNRKAEIFGNVEQALKMAMVLHWFSREYPYRALREAESGGER